jgi:hypothetical protein
MPDIRSGKRMAMKPSGLSQQEDRPLRRHMLEGDELGTETSNAEKQNFEEDSVQDFPLKKLPRMKKPMEGSKGLVAEVVLGRLAMFSFTIMIFNELWFGESFLQQFRDTQMHTETSLAFLSSIVAVSMSRGLDTLRG